MEEGISTVGDPSLEVTPKQYDNVTYESVIDSTIIPLKIIVLKLRVSIINLQFSSWSLIRSLKQASVLRLFN